MSKEQPEREIRALFLARNPNVMARARSPAQATQPALSSHSFGVCGYSPLKPGWDFWLSN